MTVAYETLSSLLTLLVIGSLTASEAVLNTHTHTQAHSHTLTEFIYDSFEIGGMDLYKLRRYSLYAFKLSWPIKCGGRTKPKKTKKTVVIGTLNPSLSSY